MFVLKPFFLRIYPFLTATIFQYVLEYDISRFGYTFLYTKRGRIQRGIFFYSPFGYFIYPILYIYIFYLKKYRKTPLLEPGVGSFSHADIFVF